MKSLVSETPNPMTLGAEYRRHHHHYLYVTLAPDLVWALTTEIGLQNFQWSLPEGEVELRRKRTHMK